MRLRLNLSKKLRRILMKKIVSVVLAALVAASVFAGGIKETSGAVKVGV